MRPKQKQNICKEVMIYIDEVDVSAARTSSFVALFGIESRIEIAQSLRDVSESQKRLNNLVSGLSRARKRFEYLWWDTILNG